MSIAEKNSPFRCFVFSCQQVHESYKVLVAEEFGACAAVRLVAADDGSEKVVEGS